MVEDILKTKIMKNTLIILLICFVGFATAQTKKLTKEDIFKDGTVLKYVVGNTFKIRSFGGVRYGEKDDVFDTITIKLVTINQKLHAILNDKKEKAFEVSKDQSPNYFHFHAYENVSYFDLLLPQHIVSNPSITTYDVSAKKPIKSNDYRHSSLNITYNGEELKLSTTVYKGDYMNEHDWHLVHSFNDDDKDFPLLVKEYFIVDKDTYDGVYCKLISIETKK